MPDSDDLSTPANLPADTELEASLRRIVREAVKKDEEISVNIVRSRTEKELGLDAGFFKDNESWRTRSKSVINEAVEEPESPEKPKPKPKLIAKAGTKRKSDEKQPQRKRAKNGAVPNSEDTMESFAESAEFSEPSEAESEVNKKPAQTKSEDESVLSEPPADILQETQTKQNGKTDEDDESDLSSIIDDGPPKKGRQKKRSSSPKARKAKPSISDKAAKPSAKAIKPKDLSPDEEEIKRLQGWLIKCGIRKLWHKELASYSTSKEKIKHLKSMLEDVGMTPRYSVEKARQIKEARELRAEIEAATEFNEQWGHAEEENGGDGKKESAPPTRRLKPKGLVDLGDDDEDSE